MATEAQTFRAQAAAMRAQAAASNLPQVRDRCIRSAEKLDEMVARMERAEAMRIGRPK